MNPPCNVNLSFSYQFVSCVFKKKSPRLSSQQKGIGLIKTPRYINSRVCVCLVYPPRPNRACYVCSRHVVYHNQHWPQSVCHIIAVLSVLSMFVMHFLNVVVTVIVTNATVKQVSAIKPRIICPANFTLSGHHQQSPLCHLWPPAFLVPKVRLNVRLCVCVSLSYFPLLFNLNLNSFSKKADTLELQ